MKRIAILILTIYLLIGCTYIVLPGRDIKLGYDKQVDTNLKADIPLIK